MTETARRLDAELVARGLVRTRSHAQDLIRCGAVRVDEAVVTKVAQKVTRSDHIAVDAGLAAHVGRGARKLVGALDAFAIPVGGRTALDVGSSTGGFTQVLLERGAVKVYAVDVGSGQLSVDLRDDPRIDLYEETDIRSIEPALLNPAPNLVVVDVSFISSRLVVSAVTSCAAVDAEALVLVKPQFEVGSRFLDGRGVVRDPAIRVDAVRASAAAFADDGWTLKGVKPSAVAGTRGNQEYFLWLSRGPAGAGDGGTGLPIDEIGPRLLGDWEGE